VQQRKVRKNRKELTGGKKNCCHLSNRRPHTHSLPVCLYGTLSAFSFTPLFLGVCVSN